MISAKATFKWNERTKINLEKAPEKIMRSIARQTLDLTGSAKVVARRDGDTEDTMYSEGIKGDFKTGLYIGNFTDYASYVYEPKRRVHWTNPNTKPKWFEYIWQKNKSSIIKTAIKETNL